MIRRNIFDVDYDSKLGFPDQSNMTPFTLVLKVYLNPMNPDPGKRVGHLTDDQNKRFIYQTWNDAEWTIYKKEFKRDVERHLNWPKMDLYLLPTVDSTKMSNIQIKYFMHRRPLRKNSTPYLRCGIGVELQDKQQGAHVAFDVMRLRDGQPNFRSFDDPVEGGQDSGILTNRDVDLWNKSRPKNGVKQNVVSHELGHVLGLDHINANNPTCKVDPNAKICYGRKGTRKYYNWMGHGNQVTGANSSPWLDRIPDHARSLDWHVTTHRPGLIDI